MTKNAKTVLIAILGVGLLGGIFVVFAAIVVGVGLIAAAENEAENNNGNIRIARGKNQQQQQRRGKSGEDSKKSNGVDAKGSISPELIGTWGKSEGSGSIDYTGKTQYRSSRINIYRFSADGKVNFTMNRETLTIMQCNIKEKKIAEGKASTEGDTLIIDLDEGAVVESNSCEGGETVEKTSPAETLRLKWNLKTENETAELCLQDESGVESCYDKQ